MREPGPDHPITIAPHGKRVRVTAGGVTVAESSRALVLKEAQYDPVFYIPRADVRWDHFVHNPRTTFCPYKGEARYYDLTTSGTIHSAAVWSYENPFPAMAPIKDHLAFYPDKVDAIEEIEG